MKFRLVYDPTIGSYFVQEQQNGSRVWNLISGGNAGCSTKWGGLYKLGRTVRRYKAGNYPTLADVVIKEHTI